MEADYSKSIQLDTIEEGYSDTQDQLRVCMINENFPGIERPKDNHPIYNKMNPT